MNAETLNAQSLNAESLSTLGATTAPRHFFDVYRTAKVVLAKRVRRAAVPTEPCFDERATAHLRSQLERARNYLEYGSGGSTILANRFVNTLVSVDCDASHIAAVHRKLAGEGRRAMTRLIHANIGLTLESGMPAFTKPTRRRLRRWGDYPTSPWKYFRSIAQQPDLILVNGLFRVSCVLESLLSLSPLSNTPILVADYADSPHYHEVERFADFEGVVGTMGVLRPRRLIDRIQVRRLVRQYCADPR
jgi:hypothetical protein